MKRWLALLLLPISAGAQTLGYTPRPYGAFLSTDGIVWNAMSSGLGGPVLGFSPTPIALYCNPAQDGTTWTPCTLGGGGSLPTATAANQFLVSSGAGTTYTATQLPTSALVLGTNSGGAIVSQPTTGTGNNVLGTSPTIATPAISSPTWSGTSSIPVGYLNTGTNASSSTFWRGDGTWAAAGGASLPTGTTGQTLYYASGGTTATATSAITAQSASAGASLGLNGQVIQINGGPTSIPSWNGSCSSVSTTCTLSSTTGLPTGGGLLLAVSNGAGANEILSYAAVSGATVTGLVRGLYGTTATNLGNSNNVYFINHLNAVNTSTLPTEIGTSQGISYFLPSGATLNGPNGGFAFVGAPLFSNGGYVLGNNQAFSSQGANVSGLQSYFSGTNYWGVDTAGQTATLTGTQAVTAGTTPITPNGGYNALTGTAPTSGTLVTIVAQNACVVTGYTCQIVIDNQTTAAITTGTTGNFFAAYTFALNTPATCFYLQATSKWKCHV